MRRTHFFNATWFAAVLGVTGASLAACGGDDEPLFPGESSSSGADGGGGIDTNKPAYVPAPAGMRRVLGRQYTSSIRLLLGDAAAAATTPPVDYSLYDFDAIGAADLSVIETAAEEYEASAAAVADVVLSDPSVLAQTVPCVASGPQDASCIASLVSEFGRMAWRRSLTPDESARLNAIGDAANLWALNEPAKPDPFFSSVKYVLMAILESPNFLYMVEVGQPDPDKPEQNRLTQVELVTRMSFFLLGRTPDASFLDQAEAGLIDSPEAVRQVALQMLADPEAKEALHAFYAELLRLNDLDTVAKNASIFPTFSTPLALSMKQSTLELIDDIVWTRDADIRELYTADYAFVDPDLATLYGVSPPASGFQKVTLPPEQKRAGFFGSAAFLTRFAHPATTSPTRRGNFIFARALCDEVPPPPPGVDITIPPDDPNNPMTMKEKLAVHQENETCANCHAIIDPPGLALENYDGIGAYRTVDENGLAIETDGSVVGFGEFSSSRELADVIIADSRSEACVIKNLIRSSMGRLEQAKERPAIDDLVLQLQEGNYRLQDILVELCLSPAFQVVGDPK